MLFRRKDRLADLKYELVKGIVNDIEFINFMYDELYLDINTLKVDGVEDSKDEASFKLSDYNNNTIFSVGMTRFKHATAYRISRTIFHYMWKISENKITLSEMADEFLKANSITEIFGIYSSIAMALKDENMLAKILDNKKYFDIIIKGNIPQAEDLLELHLCMYTVILELDDFTL